MGCRADFHRWRAGRERPHRIRPAAQGPRRPVAPGCVLYVPLYALSPFGPPRAAQCNGGPVFGASTVVRGGGILSAKLRLALLSHGVDAVAPSGSVADPVLKVVHRETVGPG